MVSHIERDFQHFRDAMRPGIGLDRKTVRAFFLDPKAGFDIKAVRETREQVFRDALGDVHQTGTKYHAADIDRIGGVHGTGLGKHHRGYFKSPVIAQNIASTALDWVNNSVDHIIGSQRKITIVGIGSGASLPEVLTERLLREKGMSTQLILSDIVREAFIDHYVGYAPSEDVMRIVCDARKMALGNEMADIAIARCSFHYQATREERAAAMKEAWLILRPGGVLIAQEHAIPTQAEKELSNAKRRMVGKHSQHDTTHEVFELYDEVFGRKHVSLSRHQPPAMQEDAADYAERFKLGDEVRDTILNRIVAFIRQLEERYGVDQLPNVKMLDDVENPFLHMTPMQIISVQKPEECSANNS